MVLLEPDPFLNELNKLFERNKGKGTVFITMKRSSLKPRNGKAKVAPADHRCLIRATDGDRKISTTLSPAQHAKFQASYALILRAHMDSLKKREKVKVKKGEGK
ncbi:signal recognition particle 14 kDa [Raphidocelis subcapitata]|uniref:Signal recognition particle 14 kDa protein n=1 Tax=Raphidocelis subcapitata TaxID=307507 RepID=A0A2V0P2S2_9CHLO|nr:signal recognition particle 14 kDa [Raphidocelis subcapitata]|eukprot:GBF94156.1 signal recognition particle 14 kDa [Raphidocelis subcapitata]